MLALPVVLVKIAFEYLRRFLWRTQWEHCIAVSKINNKRAYTLTELVVISPITLILCVIKYGDVAGKIHCHFDEYHNIFWITWTPVFCQTSLQILEKQVLAQQFNECLYSFLHQIIKIIYIYLKCKQHYVLSNFSVV